GPGAFAAPMNGVIVKRMVEPGIAVTAGQALMVMEAMKMEHSICAPAAGQVVEYFFDVGDQVSGGDELLTFKIVD
ncbi:MAG: acetyl-CoA carboxylase biotin carboxyl carrier protein subunit, partial [Xanthomonadales bacterium]|nr:acetyl-CoA carboxylase biotin carboxyl carrier protein subunit [Xanthomonadales bacterium]